MIISSPNSFESANIYEAMENDEGADQEVDDAELREVYRRFFFETVDEFDSQADFARATGIAPSEVTMAKKGDRPVTQGQILKIVRRPEGPPLSVALGKLALHAAQVEAELAMGHNPALRVEGADPEMATFVTAHGQRLAVAPERAAELEDAIKEEAGKAAIAGAKRRRKKRSAPSAEQKPSPPSGSESRPSRDK